MARRPALWAGDDEVVEGREDENEEVEDRGWSGGIGDSTPSSLQRRTGSG